MANENANGQRERRGFLILAALILAALLVFNLDVLVDWTRGYVDVVAIVGETSGIRPGSPVWVEGVEAGRVRGLGIHGHGDSAVVMVDVRLEDRARALVRSGSDVYTTRRRFIGEPIVRIEAGDPRTPPIGDGDTLHGSNRTRVQDLVEQGRLFPAALDSLTDTLERLQALVERRRPELGSLADRLAAVTGEAARLGRDLEGGTVDRLLSDPELGGRIDALRGRLGELDAAVDSARGRFAGSGELGARLDALARTSGELEAELSILERRLGEGSGTLARLQQDSALAVAVAGVRARIDSLRSEALSLAARMFLP